MLLAFATSLTKSLTALQQLKPHISAAAYTGLSRQSFVQQLLYQSRTFATIEQLQPKIDVINDKFVEARDEIEYATEDAETTYFNESAKTAKDAVAQVLTAYEEVLSELDEAEKAKLQRSMGMKIEQLKAELDQLDHLHA